MVILAPQRLQLAAWLVAAVAVIAMSVGMPWYVGRMVASEQAGHGGMVGCPLMFDSAAICPMQLNDHLAHWRQLMTAVVPPLAAWLLVAALSCLSIWLILRRDWLLDRVKRKFSVFRYLDAHRSPRTSFVGTLEWALSRGILHPKIYPADNR